MSSELGRVSSHHTVQRNKAAAGRGSPVLSCTLGQHGRHAADYLYGTGDALPSQYRRTTLRKRAFKLVCKCAGRKMQDTI